MIPFALSSIKQGSGQTSVNPALDFAGKSTSRRKHEVFSHPVYYVSNAGFCWRKQINNPEGF
jgi:hypothetical protein